MEYTWKRGERRTKLDHGISCNIPVASPKAKFNTSFDHSILSFGLHPEEFARKLQPARRSLALTDRMDAVFFQNHVRAWQVVVQDSMLPVSYETDGDAFMKMQRADQELIKEEVLKLQLREAKAWQRAKERLPGRSKG